MIAIILWVSAIASAFIDNIPFAATMIPIIKTLAVEQGVALPILAGSEKLGTDIGGSAACHWRLCQRESRHFCRRQGWPSHLLGSLLQEDRTCYRSGAGHLHHRSVRPLSVIRTTKALPVLGSAFSWDLRRRLLFQMLWTTGQNRRNLSNTVPEGLMSSEKAFLCCGKKSLDS